MTRLFRPFTTEPTGRARGTGAGLLLGLLVFAALAVLGGPQPAIAHASTFADVPESNLAHAAIEYLSKAGVVSGYQDDTFRPGVSLNRGQAAKMLVRQRGVTVASSLSHRFTDVDAVYGPYVEAAAGKGWISGYSDGSFHTYEPLQRQHMAVIMVRSLGWEDDAAALSRSQVETQLKAFSDWTGISATARPYVAVALARGLFEGGKDGRFSPTAAITRAQFSLVAYRAEIRDLAMIEGVRAGTDHSDKTRLVFDLSRGPGTVKSHMSGSSVLVIEVAGAAIAGGVLDSRVGSDEVDSTAARQLTYRPQVVRVTLTLNRFSRFEVSTLEPSDGKGYRLMVDVFTRADGPPGAGPPLVALDAGHGGSDTGAVGITGVLEKDINLAITLAVDKLLRDAGLRTLLTRSDDSYPTLGQRTDLANQAQANVFVSIHNNSSGDPASNGTETFYWGTAEEYSVEGKKLAEAIHRNLIATLGSVDRGARTHWKNLHVLAASDMPSALAEVGFLSNAEEEAKLSDPAYRQKAAEAIAHGVLEYLGWLPSTAPPAAEGTG